MRCAYDEAVSNAVTGFLSAWPCDPFIAGNLALVLALYLWAARRVTIRDPKLPWPRSATACAVIAVVLLAAMYLGPMAAWAHTFLWVHMTQHLVAMMVAAPLLVLSAPVTLIFRASSGPARRRWVVPALRSRAVRVLTNPVLTWLVFAAVLLGVHFTPFYDWSLRNHDADMLIKQPLFLLAGFLFYFPLIGSNLQPPRPSYGTRLMLMGSMMIPEAIVGATLFFASVPLYPTFASAVRPFGLEPLPDQHLAGATMWAFIMVMDSFWLMDMVRGWMASEERRARRLDAEIIAERAVQP